MRLRVKLPQDYVETSSDEESTVATNSAFAIEVTRISPAPIDMASWMRELLKRKLPDGGDLRVLGSTTARSELGWPITLVDGIVVRGEEIHEHRMYAVYEMLGHVGSIIVSTTDAKRYSTELQSFVLPLVTNAWPDWTSRTPVALDELWSLQVTPPNT